MTEGGHDPNVSDEPFVNHEVRVGRITLQE